MRWVFGILVSLFLTNMVEAKYYCLIFSWDSRIPMPHKCHTFGTFVHIENGKLIEEVTLSWTPVFRWQITDRPVEGYHQSLKRTIEFALENKWVVRAWSPLEIKRELFLEAKKQYERQDEMRYKFMDCVARRKTKDVVNCIHCISDVVGPHKTYISYGLFASDSVHKHFVKRGKANPVNNYEDIAKLLDIDDYPIRKIK